MKRSLLLLLLFVSVFKVFSSSDSTGFRRKSRLVLWIDLGITRTSSNLNTGSITDPLINFSQKTTNFQFASTFFFTKNTLGIEALISLRYYDELKEHAFKNSLQEKYSSQYYHDFKNFSEEEPGGYYSILAGPAYKFTQNQLMVMPRILLGTTIISTGSESFRLKEKNAHTVKSVDLISKEKDHLFFTVSPSVRIAFAIHKRIFLQANIGYEFFHTNFNYEIRTKNMVTGSKTTEIVKYKMPVHSFSISGGLGFGIF